MKHKAGGGDKKIFDDKYVKKSNPSSNTPSEHGGGSTSMPQSPIPPSAANNISSPASRNLPEASVVPNSGDA